jgi:hypothetical protein
MAESKVNEARVERAWQAWCALSPIDRTAFFDLVRERLAVELDTARRKRGSTLPPTSLRHLAISEADLAR